MALNVEISSLPEVLFFLVREGEEYRSSRTWGTFDALRARAIDDMFFAQDETCGALYAFASEPPHADSCVVVAVPLQIALERTYFHLAEPERLVLNPRGVLHHASVVQQGVDFSTPDDFDPEVVILRDDIPEILGALAAGPKQAGSRPHDVAEGALRRGSFFEAFFLARSLRERDVHDSRAWFIELLAASFFANADDVLALYEEYPQRGSAEPHAQLLAARYRLLLNQMNEARTILHTLTYDKALGALASCEQARSFLKEKLYTRAMDGAAAALAKDGEMTEGYLIRGMAQRGISYESGDRDGLLAAYSDFERVAKGGGYNAAEALYHAGTVSARLGALPAAEELFRKSLFQRSRTSPRDALIRVLHAQGKSAEALCEFEILKRVAPRYVEAFPELSQVVSAQIDPAQTADKTSNAPGGALWAGSYEECAQVARQMLGTWGVPTAGDVTDCAMLDDLINRFAPDGDFPQSGRFSDLFAAGHKTVARAFALHIGALLAAAGNASWGEPTTSELVVVTAPEELRIPLERFVHDRILLGASGDNFSSLESLVLEVTRSTPHEKRYRGQQWWEIADHETQQGYQRDVDWVREILSSCGMELRNELSDLEALDLWIEQSFEVGGGFSDQLKKSIGPDIGRFVSALGLLVGATIARRIPSTWYRHERAEGISIVSGDLGRLFPVARLQRRVYLSSAADFATKLSSLAWSAAVAAITEKLRSGVITGRADVEQALKRELPSIQSFPEHELQGVVDSLMIGVSLP